MPAIPCGTYTVTKLIYTGKSHDTLRSLRESLKTRTVNGIIEYDNHKGRSGSVGVTFLREVEHGVEFGIPLMGITGYLSDEQDTLLMIVW